MERSQLSLEQIERIDTEYEKFRQVRLAIAHPTCLLGEDDCGHDDCSDPKFIAEFIKKHLSLDKTKKKTVDMCLQACYAAAFLSGRDIL